MKKTEGDARRAVLTIQNRLGLHARAATMLVKTVAAFDAEVLVSKDGREIDGRSILGLMTLEAGQGSAVEFVASGPQAQEVLDALADLLARRFDEDE